MIFNFDRKDAEVVGFTIKADTRSAKEKELVKKLPIILAASGYYIGNANDTCKPYCLGAMLLVRHPLQDQIGIGYPEDGQTKVETIFITREEADLLDSLLKDKTKQANIDLGTATNTGFSNENLVVRFGPARDQVEI